jgi:phosphate transport system protein
MASATKSYPEIAALTLRACHTATDASVNVAEFIEKKSNMAFLAVKDCERELDQIETEIDDSLPRAISQVSEARARELLACLKMTTDLERIGDLLWWVTQRLKTAVGQLAISSKDRANLLKMSLVLQNMLKQTTAAFVQRDVTLADRARHLDAEVDSLRRTIFQAHLAGGRDQQDGYTVDILLMAQAFERVGDHVKNLAEEVFYLVKRRSSRHMGRKMEV